MHIPKTAGSTLATALALNYRPTETIHVDLMDRPVEAFEAMTDPSARARARLVRGHFPYGVDRFMPRPCDYVTILREPVARATSAYKFILRNPRAFRTHPLHDPRKAQRGGLEAYLEDEELGGSRGNRQTRLLSGSHKGGVGEDALEKAKVNLERFLVIGLTERFEESFAMIRRALRLKIPFYVSRLVAPSVDVSDRAKELIRTQNELDIELYEYAKHLFARQIGAQGRTFAFETAVFRALGPVSRAAGRGRVERTLITLGRSRATRRQSSSAADDAGLPPPEE